MVIGALLMLLMFGMQTVSGSTRGRMANNLEESF